MCSKPHFSVIEESCPEKFVSDNGFTIHTINGGAGDNVNMSFPVFKLTSPGEEEKNVAELTFITCDFEVCLGECTPDCSVPPEPEEEEVNYLCEGREEEALPSRKRRSTYKTLKEKLKENHILTSLGPFSRTKKLTPTSESVTINLTTRKTPIQVKIIEEFNLQGFGRPGQRPNIGQGGIGSYSDSNPSSVNYNSNIVRVFGQNFSYQGFVIVTVAVSMIITLLLVMIGVYGYTNGIICEGKSALSDAAKKSGEENEKEEYGVKTNDKEQLPAPTIISSKTRPFTSSLSSLDEVEDNPIVRVVSTTDSVSPLFPT